MATKAIVGEKVGMTQLWDDDNKVIPVTVVRVTPCRVVQVKSLENDGYTALQVTWGTKKASRVNSPEAGHFGDVEPGVKLVELRLDDVSDYEVGQELKVDQIYPGEWVDVTAVSKGKGFAGVMKRHNFAGQRASHGAHKVHRKPGAVGQCATPSRVFRGKKLPGRMGGSKVTTQNLKVVAADADRDLLMVKGSVPGAKGATVIVRNAVKGGPVIEPPAPAVEEAPANDEAATEEGTE